MRVFKKKKNVILLQDRNFPNTAWIEKYFLEQN